MEEVDSFQSSERTAKVTSTASYVILKETVTFTAPLKKGDVKRNELKAQRSKLELERFEFGKKESMLS